MAANYGILCGHVYFSEMYIQDVQDVHFTHPGAFGRVGWFPARSDSFTVRVAIHRLLAICWLPVVATQLTTGTKPHFFGLWACFAWTQLVEFVPSVCFEAKGLKRRNNTCA